MEEPSKERVTLSDREREAFQEVFNLLIPMDFSILSFNKKRMIKSLMKIVEEDIAITLEKIQQTFKKLSKRRI